MPDEARMRSARAALSVSARGQQVVIGPRGPAGANASDPWTYVKLGSPFTTDSNTAVDITGLLFTPAASKQYEFRLRLWCRSDSLLLGPRLGLTWPTGMSEGEACIRIPTSTTAAGTTFGTTNATILSAGSLTWPSTSLSFPCIIDGMVLAGGSPSGNVQFQIAAGVAATVIVRGGSFLAYRLVA